MVKRQGIVLEVHNRWAIILNEKGQYKKIKTARPIQVGELWSESSLPPWKLAAAAVIILALLAAYADFFSVVAYAQVSSGVKIGVNRWDRVVRVEASNAQTAEYVKQANFKGRKIDEVVEQVVTETITESKYSAHDRPVLTVTTTRKDEINRQRLVQKLNKKVQPIIKKINPVIDSDEKSKSNSNLPAVKSREEKPGPVKIKTGNRQVSPIDIPKNPSANGGKNNGNQVRPLESKDKPGMQKDDIKAKDDQNADFTPGKKKDAESLPATGNKHNKKVEHSEKQQSTSPAVNINRKNGAPDRGSQGSEKNPKSIPGCKLPLADSPSDR